MGKTDYEVSDPVDYVLRHITNQFGGSIALVTSQSVKHLEQNIMNIGG